MNIKLMTLLLMLVLIIGIGTVRDAESQEYYLGDINYASFTLTWEQEWMQIDVYNGSTSSVVNERINELFFDFSMPVGTISAYPSDWVDGSPGSEESFWLGASFRDYAINKGSIGSFVWDCNGDCPLAFDVDVTYHDLDNGSYSDSYSVNVVPEPMSSLLFIAGGSTFAFRRFLKKRRIS